MLSRTIVSQFTGHPQTETRRAILRRKVRAAAGMWPRFTPLLIGAIFFSS
jgi:hypothetical protein